MIRLGNRVQDSMTGFKGIAVEVCYYLNGCTQWLIQPEELKDGQPAKPDWFDEQRVESLELDVVKPAKAGSSGGQQNTPPEPSHPE